MLTKEDLKAIGNIIDKRFAEQELRFDKKLKPIKKDISQIRKDVKVMLTLFDDEYIELRKRVERIEEYLGLPQAV